MDAAELLAALKTVEQDHHLVLERMQALVETVACLTDPANLEAKQVFGRLLELDNYFRTRFATHMGEEELTLFPLLERFSPDGTALVNRLREEHSTVRRKLDAFNRCLEAAIDRQDHPPRAVLRDLLIAGWELWELLDRHAHDETRAIHACMNRQLPGGKTPRG
jgi:hemerythrin-like domain-containing protein